MFNPNSKPFQIANTLYKYCSPQSHSLIDDFLFGDTDNTNPVDTYTKLDKLERYVSEAWNNEIRPKLHPGDYEYELFLLAKQEVENAVDRALDDLYDYNLAEKY